MTISDLVRRGSVAGVLMLTLALPAAASGSASVDLRVLTPSTTMEDGTRYVTGSATIPTDPNAECFGEGTGGSGDPVSLSGPRALGAVKNASSWNDDLLPLSVTDGLGFALGVCGIGGHEADSDFDPNWYLKKNHKEASVGGDQLRVKDGDQVLWFLSPNNFPDPAPSELTLKAPPRNTPGSFQVTVTEWTCVAEPPDFVPVCTESPAQGASVTGALTPTDANGHTNVTMNASGTVRASRAGDIPSKELEVCISADLDQCPPIRGRTIIGRNKPDDFDGTAGWDEIRARDGSDRIDIRSGGRDVVLCGNGRHDTVIGVGRKDTIASNCEHRR